MSAAALAQEQAQDVALFVSERAEAGRSALDPLPVVRRQIVLAIAPAPGCRLAVGRQLILAKVGAMNCPEPVTHDFKETAYLPLLANYRASVYGSSGRTAQHWPSPRRTQQHWLSPANAGQRRKER